MDWDAPCANDGWKAKKASPIKWIFLFSVLKKSLLTNTGNIFNSLIFSKKALFSSGTFSKTFLIKELSLNKE